MAKKRNIVTPLSLLNDEPIYELGQDGLGLENWANVVASVAVGTEGPFTIGVFGKWGVGKTSILRLSRQLVDHSEPALQGRLTTVEFNAWQYEQEGIPLIPLIATILYELDKKKGFVKRVKEDAQKLHDALRSLLFGLSTKVTGKMGFLGEASLNLDTNKAIERYETLRSHWVNQQIDNSLYYNAFQTLRELQGAEGDERHRVVVFIDDLDRCFPDKAIQLLESMKLVLSHPGFIFVLAVDRHVLESYLDKRYTEEFGLKGYSQGQSYLDKIIQLPLWIPPHEKRFAYMVEKLLERPALTEHRAAFESLTELISLACEHNPRQLVRFFNDILVDQQVYRSANMQGEFPLHAFVIAHGIRHQSEFIYQGLLKDEALCDRMKAGKNADDLRALVMEMLKDTNLEETTGGILRDLLSRDSLVQLLASEPGSKWLDSSMLRSRVNNFLAAGWKTVHIDPEDVSWIQTQVERALTQLSSTAEDVILTACDTLLALGDQACLPALKQAKARHQNNTQVGKAISNTYRKLLLSYGEPPS